MFDARQAIALLLLLGLCAPVEAMAQAVAPASPPSGAASNSSAATRADPPRALTLKERLGAKWQDEQRVDNCKVPPEKRGPKPRPDGCAHAPAQ
jgi:hypothetical protein